MASSNQLQDVHNKTKRKISGMPLSAWFYGVICLWSVSLTATETGIALQQKSPESRVNVIDNCEISITGPAGIWSVLVLHLLQQQSPERLESPVDMIDNYEIYITGTAGTLSVLALLQQRLESTVDVIDNYEIYISHVLHVLDQC